MIYDIIEEIAATSSKKEKLKLVEAIVGTEHEDLFKKVVEYAYSPFLQYNLKKFDMPKTHSGAFRLQESFALLDALADSEISGNSAKEKTADFLHLLSEKDAQVLARILKKDLRCGATESTFNKVWPGMVYEHPYMRCSSFSHKLMAKIGLPCYSEIKSDGMYTDIIVRPSHVEYRSRDGLVKDLNYKDTDEQLMKLASGAYGTTSVPFVLMGEALVLNEDGGTVMSRKDGNGYLNKDDKDKSRIIFKIWDHVTLEEFEAKKSTRPRKERVDYVEALLMVLRMHYGADFVHLYLSSVVTCNTVEDVISHFRKCVGEGEEGTIVKKMDAIWEDGTSTEQMKMKLTAEGEVEITDVIEGEGRLKGMAGALRYKSACGEVVGTIAGMSDDERALYFKHPELVVGKIASVLFNDIVFSDTKKCYSLYLPRISEIRVDKTVADDLPRLREQMAAAVDAFRAFEGL